MLRLLPGRERLAPLDTDIDAPPVGLPTALIVALAAAAAVAVGILAAAVNPFAVAAGAAGAVVLGLVWRTPVMGLFLFILVVGVVPFGVTTGVKRRSRGAAGVGGAAGGAAGSAGAAASCAMAARGSSSARPASRAADPPRTKSLRLTISDLPPNGLLPRPWQ